MSRSKRKNPIMGITTAESEAWDKAQWHRAHRRAENARLHSQGDEFIEQSDRDVSDPWRLSKDGKRWWGPAMDSRYMRK